MHVPPTHGGRAQGMCGGGGGSGNGRGGGKGAWGGAWFKLARPTGDRTEWSETGQGGSEQSARETTTRGACDKQDGRAAERPMDEWTNKQLNEQTSQETVANTNKMTKAETPRPTHSPTQQKSHVFCVLFK